MKWISLNIFLKLSWSILCWFSKYWAVYLKEIFSRLNLVPTISQLCNFNYRCMITGLNGEEEEDWERMLNGVHCMIVNTFCWSTRTVSTDSELKQASEDLISEMVVILAMIEATAAVVAVAAKQLQRQRQQQRQPLLQLLSLLAPRWQQQHHQGRFQEICKPIACYSTLFISLLLVDNVKARAWMFIVEQQ